MDTKTYDIVGFAKNLELECEDISEIYISYIQEIEKHCEEIKGAFDKKDYIELELVIHNIKGISGNLWIADVFEEATVFNRLLKANDYTDAKEYVDRILNLLANSKDKIIKSFAEVNISL